MTTPICIQCGEDVPIARWQLGYKHCKDCGEMRAKSERESWCVVQEYTKGAYQLVTTASAMRTLKQTNPKENRV